MEAEGGGSKTVQSTKVIWKG